MSGSGPEAMRRLAAVLTWALVATSVVGCADDTAPPPSAATTDQGQAGKKQPGARPGKARRDRPRRVQSAPDTLAEIRTVLDARAQALMGRDVAAFQSTLGGSPGFAEEQREYQQNLAQLPLTRVQYVLDPASLMRTGRDYTAVVDLLLQLDGYDAGPTRSRARMTFRREPAGIRITDVSLGESGAQPWDLGPIVARRRGSVLGVFDPGSDAWAPDVLASVRRGTADVRPRVPTAWPRSVVVYALSDGRFLGSLPAARSGDTDRVDALTFTVPGLGARPAASRFVLSPRVLESSGPALDRLVRHELTHVATGPLGDAVPLWLAEGSAEWVSAQALGPADRTPPDATVAAAEAGPLRLPDASAFTGDRSRAAYGVSWWLCEYLARSYGEGAVWTLISRFRAAGAQADPSTVLRETLGVSPEQVARGARRLVLREGGVREPRPSRSPSSSPSPSPRATSSG
ncbi:hypothetical protein K8W59_09775 [Nocardioides rotundus]|uniref:hypothetical protein n=1 Tax=Nocardioides rotundus TaxID=1774216 RepID=UPI001CC05492|nr:hypothetical protein [Nocardioides rotundus]UAL31686.1 hypothetical protein K8W59_09775 [Nocardioides rotundus]